MEKKVFCIVHRHKAWHWSCLNLKAFGALWVLLGPNALNAPGPLWQIGFDSDEKTRQSQT